jgi:hypothetical protein
VNKLRAIKPPAHRWSWDDELRSIQIGRFADSLSVEITRLAKIDSSQWSPPDFTPLQNVIDALSFELRKLNRIKPLSTRFTQVPMEFVEQIAFLTDEVGKLRPLQLRISDSPIFEIDGHVNLISPADSLIEELNRLLYAPSPGASSLPSPNRVQTYVGVLVANFDKLRSLDTVVHMDPRIRPQPVPMEEWTPDYALRLTGLDIRKRGSEPFMMIEAYLKNLREESTEESTVRLVGTPSGEGGTDSRPPMMFASIRNIGEAPLPLRRIRIQSSAPDSNGVVITDTLDITMPHLAPGEEAPIQLRLRVPNPDRPQLVSPGPTVIRGQNATIIVPGDTTVIVRYDTVFVGRDTTVVVRSDTVIVNTETGQSAIVQMHPDTTVITPTVGPASEVDTGLNTNWLWILVPLLSLLGAAAMAPFLSRLMKPKQKREKDKVVTLFTFYDVKERKKVLSEVVAKAEYEAEGRTTYAFKGKTDDGRDLTKFVSKDHYDKVELSSDSGQTTPSKSSLKRPTGLRSRLKEFLPRGD